jgi:hypothetical protein
MKTYSIVLRLDNGDTATERITVPDSAGEITLLQWCRVQEIEPPDVLQEDDNIDTLPMPHRVTSWLSIIDYARKVLSVFDVSESIIVNADLSELQSEQADGLLAMFVDLVTSVNGYQPKFRERFKFKGRTFSFPENVQQSFGQLLIGGRMSMGQASDALQLDQALSATGEDGKPLMNDQRYHRDLAVVASLSREIIGGDVERPPLDWVDRRKWLDERVELFEDLPMDIALDGCFFLSSLKVRLVATLSSALRLRASLLTQLSQGQ